MAFIEKKIGNQNFFTEEHSNMLPTVRIKSVELNNFKSVGHGEIEMQCGRQYIPYGTKSDITGIYGQNGSGKTSLIEALAILRKAMSGGTIPSSYADCIAINKEFSRLHFTFDLQYPNEEVREVNYSFSIKKVERTDEEFEDGHNKSKDQISLDNASSDYRVQLFDEVLELSWIENEKRKIKQTIVNTSDAKRPFGPATKLNAFIGKSKEAMLDLEIIKEISMTQSRSFIFSQRTLAVFKDTGLYSVYYQVLLELNLYAKWYLVVVDTRSSGCVQMNFQMPIFTREGRAYFDSRKAEILSFETYFNYSETLESMSLVLSQLVPGLTIKLKNISDTLMKNGDPGIIAMLVADRDGVELPLRDESDGVRKIISILSLIITAYNDQSFTLAIDELDAGVFEYLLGEILQAFEETGKGQLIFTSHNLRPLEIINKKFIWFTTTNPGNRYYRMKGISSTSNLRDTYIREILFGEQDEELYNRTKRFKIEAALRKAGAMET